MEQIQPNNDSNIISCNLSDKNRFIQSQLNPERFNIAINYGQNNNFKFSQLNPPFINPLQIYESDKAGEEEKKRI